MNLKIKLWLLVYYNGGFTLNIIASFWEDQKLHGVSSGGQYIT